jgi:hydrogenase maturation protease
MNTVIVIGVGNEFRHDDAFGPAVLEYLRAKNLPGVEYATSDGEPSRLIELWSGASTAVVVDAVRVPSPRPGRIHRISAEHPAASPAGLANTHGIALGDAVALARVLDQLPLRLLLLAVEAADTDFGVGLSAGVAAAVPVVADEIADLLGTSLTPEDAA